MVSTTKIDIEMKENNNILSDEGVDYINNTLCSIFTEKESSIISLNIIELNKEIDKILKSIKLEKVTVGKNDKFKVVNSNNVTNTLLTEAYLLIFKIREFLTSENIDYRYYFTSAKGAQVVSFTDKDFLRYVKNGQYGLQVLVSAVKKADKNTTYQKLLDEHYDNLMAGLEAIRDNSTVYHVHKEIMLKYIDKNPNLRKYPGTDDETYTLFNQGHVFEAMDKAFAEAIIKEKINSFIFIKNAMYGKYLKRDSGKGIKSGDNEMTMTQIKSQQADYMQYSTLLKALEDIKEIFKIPPEIEKDVLKNKLIEVFVDKNRYKTKKAYNEVSEEILKKALNIIEKT